MRSAREEIRTVILGTAEAESATVIADEILSALSEAGWRVVQLEPIPGEWGQDAYTRRWEFDAEGTDCDEHPPAIPYCILSDPMSGEATD